MIGRNKLTKKIVSSFIVFLLFFGNTLILISAEESQVNNETITEPIYQDNEATDNEDELPQNQENVSEETTEITGETSSESNLEMIPKVITNGGVTLDIPDYNATNKWNVETVYNVNVKVDFANATTNDKQIKITLPAGMRFVSIPVHKSQGVAGKDVEVTADSILSGAIKSVSMPPASTLYNTIDNKKNYSGELTYNINPNMSSVEIKGLQVTVDGSLYYQPKTITQGISINANHNNGIQVGNVSMDIQSKGNVAFARYSAGGWGKLDIMENDTTPFSTSLISFYRSGELYPKAFYYKKMEITYYFPKEFEYQGISTIDQGFTVTEVNQDSGYVKIEANNLYTNVMNGIQLQLANNGTPIGKYLAPGPKAVITTYDGQEIVVDYGTEIPVEVNVLSINDPIFSNKLGIKSSPKAVYNPISDDHFTMAPRFDLTTPKSKGKENQVIEYTIDANYEVISLGFPSAATNKITKIEYKTNLNNTLRVATGNQIQQGNTPPQPELTSYKITNESLNLVPNEYIIYAKAFVGDFPKNMVNSNRMEFMDQSIFQILGRLKTGVTSADVKLKTWAEDPQTGMIETDSHNEISKTVTKDINDPSFFITSVADTKLMAGKTKRISASLNSHRYYYSQTSGIVNPTIYLRQPSDFSINKNTIKLMFKGEELIPTSITEQVISSTGEKVIKIETEVKIGNYFGNADFNPNALNIYFDITASILANNNYTWNDLVFFETENKLTHSNSQLEVQKDKYDVNNNGNTTETLGTLNKNKLTIIEQKVLTLDTYITPEGDTRQPAYDISKPETAINFTPRATADYTIDIFNNRDDNVDRYISYIPIPKSGQNFGESFQSTDFKWNMKLNATTRPDIEVYDRDGNLLPGEVNNYKLSYSENEVASNFTTTNFYDSGATTGTYTNSITNNTHMIKLEKTTPINSGERVIVKFKYEIDETATSAIGKVGTINDFRPHYFFEAGSKGVQSGTRVGARLEIGEISGKLFEDVNVNGIYDAGDKVSAGKKIRLYKKDASGNYVEHQNSPTVTKADGSYNFGDLENGNYRVDFNDALTTGQHEFTLRKQGTDDKIDSDVAFSGGTRGLIDDIDPTKDNAKAITAGYISYNASTDLKLQNIPSKITMKASNMQTVSTTEINGTFSPTFFDKIKASKDAASWSTSDATIASISGLDKAIITAGQTTGNMQNATITLTLKDMYGNTTTQAVPVEVTSNDIPVITANDILVEKGSLFDPTNIAVNIQDTEDGSISLSDQQKVKIQSTVPVNSENKATTVGQYTIKYSVTDSDKNTSEKTVNILVTNGPPVVDPEDPIIKYTITAKDFSVALADVETSDFVELAKAKGYKLVNDSVVSDTEQVTMIGDKPTKVGLYDVKFSSNGAEATVKVLVTNKPPVTDPDNPTIKYTMTAKDFTVALADVETSDFVELAKAKGYKLVDGTIVSDTEVVNLIGDKPTQVGEHDVTFNSNGAEAIVKVLVTNEPPVVDPTDPTIKYTITAEDFTIPLKDVNASDFVSLANAKGYKLIDETIVSDSEQVSLIGEKPLTVGMNDVTFISNGARATIKVNITSEITDYELKANNISMGISELKQALENGNLESEIITRSDAKVVNLVNDEEKIDDIEAEVLNLTVPGVKTYDVKITFALSEASAFSVQDSSETIEKQIQMTIIDDTSKDGLPTSGTYTFEVLIFAITVIMLNALLIGFIHFKKRKIAN